MTDDVVIVILLCTIACRYSLPAGVSCRSGRSEAKRREERRRAAGLAARLLTNECFPMTPGREAFGFGRFRGLKHLQSREIDFPEAKAAAAGILASRLVASGVN